MLYLDYAATCPAKEEVIDVFNKVIKTYFGNPNALHKLGQLGEQLIERSRLEISKLLDVKANEIYFTSGATEANNMAIKGVAFRYPNRGKHIITTNIEHSSVYEVCKYLEERFGYEVTYLDCDATGMISAKIVEQALRNDTVLVSIMHVNSEVGLIQPLEEIGNVLKKFPKTLFHVDATQGLGKIPISIKKCNIDLLSFSSHKIGGIPNTGFLYKREGLQIDSLLNGGKQEDSLRAGTQSTALNVSTAKALKIAFDQQKKELQTIIQLNQLLRNELSKMDGIVINSPVKDCSPFVLNISIPTLKPETVLHALEEHEIYISTQSACTSKDIKISRVLKAMNKSDDIASSSLRISTYYGVKEQDIIYFIEHFQQVLEVLRKVV